MFSRKHTPEAKLAVSKANKGKPAWNKGCPQTDKVKEAVSKANKGNLAWNKDKPRSDEEKQHMKAGWAKKISEGYEAHNKGKTLSKDYVCEHCKRSFSKPNFTRWHGDKCKEA